MNVEAQCFGFSNLVGENVEYALRSHNHFKAISSAVFGGDNEIKIGKVMMQERNSTGQQ